MEPHACRPLHVVHPVQIAILDHPGIVGLCQLRLLPRHGRKPCLGLILQRLDAANPILVSRRADFRQGPLFLRPLGHGLRRPAQQRPGVRIRVVVQQPPRLGLGKVEGAGKGLEHPLRLCLQAPVCRQIGLRHFICHGLPGLVIGLGLPGLVPDPPLFTGHRRRPASAPRSFPAAAAPHRPCRPEAA